MGIFNDNINFIFSKYRLSNREIYRISGIHESTISNLRHDRQLSRHTTIQKLARGLSEATALPYELFKDGQAFFDENFPETIKAHLSAQKLQYKGNTPQTGEQVSEYRSHDRKALNNALENTSETTVNNLVELLNLVKDNDGLLEQIIGMIKLLRGSQ